MRKQLFDIAPRFFIISGKHPVVVTEFSLGEVIGGFKELRCE